MSGLTTTFVSCRPPTSSTLPEGTTSLPIAPISLWPMGTVESVFTFPEELDKDKLEQAIGLLTSVWPTLGGRYVRRAREGEDGKFDFSFNLTSSPIPFSTQTITSAPDPFPFPTRLVIQDTLHPYLPPLGPTYHIPNKDEPLFVVRLTTILPFRSSVLGINMSHLIGDGEMGLRLVKLLELFYLHGEKVIVSINDDKEDVYRLSGFLLPTFGDHTKLPPFQPEWDDLYSSWSSIGHDGQKRFEAFKHERETNERMTIEFNQGEIKKLKDVWMDKEKTGILSGQDVLSGWWIQLMERLGMKIDLVEYVCSHRLFCVSHPSYPPDLPTLAANVSRVRTIALQPHQLAGLDPGQIATLVRKAINELRSDPDITLPWLSGAAHHLEQAAIQDRGQILACGDGQVFINSNIRMNWHVSFGFQPHQTTYHTAHTGLRYLRVYQANPREGERLGERVELAFRLPKGGMKEAAENLVRNDQQELADM
ncbi:hypothetical protein IAR55_000141 [Kwoniella newhampshirensis]|uniref:Uncharacterized protein n=1 Tax=Kwoniella newhampshirensis TaxID=1651941 RepID=A0AAW0Z5T7_9TREE